MSSDKPLFTTGSLISIPHVRFAITGKFSAPNGPGDLGTGKSYIPPCTLNMYNPSPHKQLNHKGLFQAAQSLPASFSWNNNSDIAKYKSSDMKNIITKPLNQLKCGSCWAFAVSTALSDRIGIAQGVNPNLGPSYLLACSVTGDCNKEQLAGCNGGVIATALQDMIKPIGGVQSDCWNYKWCDTCSGDGDNDNKLIPSFPQNNQKCISASSQAPLLYKVKEDSVQTIPSVIDQPDGTRKVDYTAIKESLFNHGPLPTGFIVFQDFFMGTAPKSQGGNGWAETDGVYVHLDTDTTGYTPDGDASPYKYGSSADMDTQAGGHAVVIVGWGVSQVTNPTPKAWSRLNGGTPAPSKIDIPYWIVRNSWGQQWAENGFFRIAQTNPDLHIGGTVMFDQSGNQGVGGVIDFLPDLSQSPPPNFSARSGVSSSAGMWIVISLLILAAVAGYLFYRHRALRSL
jgi:hypothetical protein